MCIGVVMSHGSVEEFRSLGDRFEESSRTISGTTSTRWHRLRGEHGGYCRYVVRKGGFFRVRGKADSVRAVDFELSSCGCGGPEDADPAKYIGTSVCTSSALEFIDRAFCPHGKIVCDVDFICDGWITAVADWVFQSG